MPYPDESLDQPFSGSGSTGSTETHARKSIIKSIKPVSKNLDPSVDPYYWPERPGVPFNFRHKEVMMESIQTQLKVFPLNAEIDDPVYVCRDLKTQTSVMCLPNENVESFVPKLKKYREHSGTEIKTRYKKDLEDYTIDIIKQIIDEAIATSRKNYDPLKEFPDVSIKLPNLLVVDDDPSSFSIKTHPLVKDEDYMDIPTLSSFTNAENALPVPQEEDRKHIDDIILELIPKDSPKVSRKSSKTSSVSTYAYGYPDNQKPQFEPIPEEVEPPISPRINRTDPSKRDTEHFSPSSGLPGLPDVQNNELEPIPEKVEPQIGTYRSNKASELSNFPPRISLDNPLYEIGGQNNPKEVVPTIPTITEPSKKHSKRYSPTISLDRSSYIFPEVEEAVYEPTISPRTSTDYSKRDSQHYSQTISLDRSTYGIPEVQNVDLEPTADQIESPISPRKDSKPPIPKEEAELPISPRTSLNPDYSRKSSNDSKDKKDKWNFNAESKGPFANDSIKESIDPTEVFLDSLPKGPGASKSQLGNTIIPDEILNFHGQEPENQTGSIGSEGLERTNFLPKENSAIEAGTKDSNKPSLDNPDHSRKRSNDSKDKKDKLNLNTEPKGPFANNSIKESLDPTVVFLDSLPRGPGASKSQLGNTIIPDEILNFHGKEPENQTGSIESEGLERTNFLPKENSEIEARTKDSNKPSLDIQDGAIKSGGVSKKISKDSTKGFIDKPASGTRSVDTNGAITPRGTEPSEVGPKVNLGSINSADKGQNTMITTGAVDKTPTLGKRPNKPRTDSNASKRRNIFKKKIENREEKDIEREKLALAEEWERMKQDDDFYKNLEQSDHSMSSKDLADIMAPSTSKRNSAETMPKVVLLPADIKEDLDILNDKDVRRISGKFSSFSTRTEDVPVFQKDLEEKPICNYCTKDSLDSYVPTAELERLSDMTLQNLEVKSSSIKNETISTKAGTNSATNSTNSTRKNDGLARIELSIEGLPRKPKDDSTKDSGSCGVECKEQPMVGSFELKGTQSTLSNIQDITGKNTSGTIYDAEDSALQKHGRHRSCDTTCQNCMGNPQVDIAQNSGKDEQAFGKNYPGKIICSKNCGCSSCQTDITLPENCPNNCDCDYCQNDVKSLIIKFEDKQHQTEDYPKLNILPENSEDNQQRKKEKQKEPCTCTKICPYNCDKISMGKLRSGDSVTIELLTGKRPIKTGHSCTQTDKADEFPSLTKFEERPKPLKLTRDTQTPDGVNPLITSDAISYWSNLSPSMRSTTPNEAPGVPNVRNTSPNGTPRAPSARSTSPSEGSRVPRVRSTSPREAPRSSILKCPSGRYDTSKQSVRIIPAKRNAQGDHESMASRGRCALRNYEPMASCARNASGENERQMGCNVRRVPENTEAPMGSNLGNCPGNNEAQMGTNFRSPFPNNGAPNRRCGAMSNSSGTRRDQPNQSSPNYSNRCCSAYSGYHVNQGPQNVPEASEPEPEARHVCGAYLGSRRLETSSETQPKPRDYRAPTDEWKPPSPLQNIYQRKCVNYCDTPCYCPDCICENSSDESIGHSPTNKSTKSSPRCGTAETKSTPRSGTVCDSSTCTCSICICNKDLDNLIPWEPPAELFGVNQIPEINQPAVPEEYDSYDSWSVKLHQGIHEGTSIPPPVHHQKRNPRREKFEKFLETLRSKENLTESPYLIPHERNPEQESRFHEDWRVHEDQLSYHPNQVPQEMTVSRLPGRIQDDFRRPQEHVRNYPYRIPRVDVSNRQENISYRLEEPPQATNLGQDVPGTFQEDPKNNLQDNLIPHSEVPQESTLAHDINLFLESQRYQEAANPLPQPHENLGPSESGNVSEKKDCKTSCIKIRDSRKSIKLQPKVFKDADFIPLEDRQDRENLEMSKAERESKVSDIPIFLENTNPVLELESKEEQISRMKSLLDNNHPDRIKSLDLEITELQMILDQHKEQGRKIKEEEELEESSNSSLLKSRKGPKSHCDVPCYCINCVCDCGKEGVTWSITTKEGDSEYDKYSRVCANCTCTNCICEEAYEGAVCRKSDAYKQGGCPPRDGNGPPDKENSDGNPPEGEAPNEYSPEGENPKEKPPESEAPSEYSPERQDPNGKPPESEAPSEYSPERQDHNGDSSKGDAPVNSSENLPQKENLHENSEDPLNGAIPVEKRNLEKELPKNTENGKDNSARINGDKYPRNLEGRNMKPIFESPRIGKRSLKDPNIQNTSKSASEVKGQDRIEAVKTSSVGCEPSKIPLELPTTEIEKINPSGDRSISSNIPPTFLDEIYEPKPNGNPLNSTGNQFNFEPFHERIPGDNFQLGLETVHKGLEYTVYPAVLSKESSKDHKSLQSLYHRDQPFKKLDKKKQKAQLEHKQNGNTENLQNIQSNPENGKKLGQVSEESKPSPEPCSTPRNITKNVIISGENNFGIDIETLQPKITDQGIQIPLIIKFNGAPCFQDLKPPKYGETADKTFVTIDAKVVQERKYNEREVQTLLALGEKIKSESLNSFPEDFECSEFTETARSDGTSKQVTTWFSSPRTTSDIEDPFLTARPSSQDPGEKYFPVEYTDCSADTIPPLPIASTPEKIGSTLDAEISATRPNSEPCSYDSKESKGRFTHVVEQKSQEKVLFFLDNLPSVKFSKECTCVESCACINCKGLTLGPINTPNVPEDKISASTQLKKCDCSHKITESGDLTICNCKSCSWNEHISKIATTRGSNEHCSTGTQLTSCFCEKDLKSQCSIRSCQSNSRKCVSSTTFTFAEQSLKSQQNSCGESFSRNERGLPTNKYYSASRPETRNDKYYGKIVSESHGSYCPNFSRKPQTQPQPKPTPYQEGYTISGSYGTRPSNGNYSPDLSRKGQPQPTSKLDGYILSGSFGTQPSNGIYSPDLSRTGQTQPTSNLEGYTISGNYDFSSFDQSYHFSRSPEDTSVCIGSAIPISLDQSPYTGRITAGSCQSSRRKSPNFEKTKPTTRSTERSIHFSPELGTRGLSPIESLRKSPLSQREGSTHLKYSPRWSPRRRKSPRNSRSINPNSEKFEDPSLLEKYSHGSTNEETDPKNKNSRKIRSPIWNSKESRSSNRKSPRDFSESLREDSHSRNPNSEEDLSLLEKYSHEGIRYNEEFVDLESPRKRRSPIWNSRSSNRKSEEQSLLENYSQGSNKASMEQILEVSHRWNRDRGPRNSENVSRSSKKPDDCRYRRFQSEENKSQGLDSLEQEEKASYEVSDCPSMNSKNEKVSITSYKSGTPSGSQSRRVGSATSIGKSESNLFPKRTTSCQIGPGTSKGRNMFVEPYFDRKDPVIAAMIACEAELRPLKESLCQVKSQLRNLNMPELNCLFDSTPLVSPRKKVTSNVSSFKFVSRPCPVRSVIKIHNPFGENTHFVEQQQQYCSYGSPSTLSKEIFSPDSFAKEDYFAISPRKRHRLPFKHSFTIPFSSNPNGRPSGTYRSPRSHNLEKSDSFYNYLRYGIAVQRAYDDLETSSTKSHPCSNISGSSNRHQSGSQHSYYDDDVIFRSTTRFNLAGNVNRKCKNRSPRSLNSNMTFCTESVRSNEDYSSDWTTLDERKSYDHCSCKYCQKMKSMHDQNNSIQSAASQCPFLEAMKSLGNKKKKNSNSKNVSTFELDYPGLEDVCLKVEMKKPKKLKKIVKY